MQRYFGANAVATLCVVWLIAVGHMETEIERSKHAASAVERTIEAKARRINALERELGDIKREVVYTLNQVCSLEAGLEAYIAPLRARQGPWSS